MCVMLSVTSKSGVMEENFSFSYLTILKIMVVNKYDLLRFGATVTGFIMRADNILGNVFQGCTSGSYSHSRNHSSYNIFICIVYTLH